MAVRSTMQDLIGRARLMTYDPDPGTVIPVFTDEEIQGALDMHRAESRYLPLAPVPTIAQGGSVTYYRFDAPCGDWETGATFLDAGYGTLTAPTADDTSYRFGQWTFGTAPNRPVYVNGASYDLNGAAADLLVEWAARVKSCVDFASGDQRFSLSQKHKQILTQAEQYRRKQRLSNSTMTRSDAK